METKIFGSRPAGAAFFSKKFHTGLWQTLLDETERAWSGAFPASPKSDGGLRYSPANSPTHQPVYP
jgi:hypothetical protein